MSVEANIMPGDVTIYIVNVNSLETELNVIVLCYINQIQNNEKRHYNTNIYLNISTYISKEKMA